MDFQRIDAAIASYASQGDDELNARLSFFRSVWEIQDSYAIKAASLPGCQLDLVHAEEIFNQLNPKEDFQKVFPLLEHLPLSIDRDLFTDALKALSRLFSSQDSFDSRATNTLKSFDWEEFVSELPLGLAGANPSAFLDSAMTLLEEKVSKNSLIERPGFIITVLALAERAMIDRYAAALLEAYKNHCVKDSYFMDQSGRCPLCGSDATVSYVGPSESNHGNAKQLWCSQCGTAWEFGRIKCPHCLTTTQDKLHYLNVEGDLRHRLYVCEDCHSYMRTYFEPTDFDLCSVPFSFEVEDVVMANLDLVAQDYLNK